MLRKLFSANGTAGRPATGEPGAAERADTEPGDLVADADRLRDAGDARAAADAYALALDRDPQRTDLRVQLANMLKDSGQYGPAEAAYRQAIGERPQDPDIHIQLGHLLKTIGRRREAMDSYRTAADPESAAGRAALRELAAMGDADAQGEGFRHALQSGGAAALLTLTAEVARMRATLDDLARALPQLSDVSAYPVAAYDVLRLAWDVPAPPTAPSGKAITVLLDLDQGSLDHLHAGLAGLQVQTHGPFKAVLFGSDGGRLAIARRLALADPRFEAVAVPTGQGAAAAELGLASKAAEGHVLLLAPSARPHPQALAWIAWAIEQTGAAAIVFDQEAVIPGLASDRRVDPVLRQTADLESLLQANVCGGSMALAPGLIRRLADHRPGDAAQTRSLALLEAAGEGGVCHLPLPLIGLPAGEAEPDPGSHRRAVEAYLKRRGLDQAVALNPSALSAGLIEVTWIPSRPDVSIGVIIPTRDNAKDAAAFVSSLLALSDQPQRIAVVVIDNGAVQPASLALLAGLADRPGVTVVRRDEPFNWSRLNTLAAQDLGAELVVFANDDMRMLSQGWDGRLAGLLARPDVGAVGARLLYGDATVQHAGVLFGWQGGGVHEGLFAAASDPGLTGRWHMRRSVSAVTGAFMAMRRADFLTAGGFDQASLPVAYSDWDMALKLRRAGLRVVYEPAITLLHHESKSRGLDHLDPVRAARNRAEARVMHERWGPAFAADPGVNPFWRVAALPFQMIAPPSLERIAEHARRSALANPWILD